MYKELYKNYKNKNISFSIGKRAPRPDVLEVYNNLDPAIICH